MKKMRIATRVRKNMKKAQTPRRIKIRTAAVLVNISICSASLLDKKIVKFSNVPNT